MMKSPIKTIKRLTLSFASVFLLFGNTSLYAAECGILQLQSNRSSGIDIAKNECDKLPGISSGAVFDLSSKGRLWLKSSSATNNDANFQLICQNKTSNTIQIEFSDMLSPWLNQAKLNNCSGWTNNKLACDGSNGENKGLFCVLSFAKSSQTKSTQVERTTSVKMRALTPFGKTNTNTDSNKVILDAINKDLALCKTLYQQDQKASVSWDVENNTAQITSSVALEDNSLSSCVKTILTSYAYPQFSKKMSFHSTF